MQYNRPNPITRVWLKNFSVLSVYNREKNPISYFQCAYCDSIKHTISAHVIRAKIRHSSIIEYICAHDSLRFKWKKKHHTYDVPTVLLFIIMAIRAACDSKRFLECAETTRHFAHTVLFLYKIKTYIPYV